MMQIDPNMPVGAAAAMGRRGDTEMAHVTPGEVVLPLSVTRGKPSRLSQVKAWFEEEGLPMGRFVVGGEEALTENGIPNGPGLMANGMGGSQRMAEVMELLEIDGEQESPYERADSGPVAALETGQASGMPDGVSREFEAVLMRYMGDGNSVNPQTGAREYFDPGTAMMVAQVASKAIPMIGSLFGNNQPSDYTASFQGPITGLFKTEDKANEYTRGLRDSAQSSFQGVLDQFAKQYGIEYPEMYVDFGFGQRDGTRAWLYDSPTRSKETEILNLNYGAPSSRSIDRLQAEVLQTILENTDNLPEQLQQAIELGDWGDMGFDRLRRENVIDDYRAKRMNKGVIGKDRAPMEQSISDVSAMLAERSPRPRMRTWQDVG